jgi:hypothetical protein
MANSFNKYFWYLVIEAVVIIGIVIGQIKVLLSLLR